MSFPRSVSSDLAPLADGTSGGVRRRFPSLPTVTCEARELVTKSVVVYKERAEVKRVITLDQLEPGKMLIRVNVSWWARE